jgi:two-component system catabolic regulation response regulator CreB
MMAARAAGLFVDRERREVWIKGEQLRPPLSAEQFSLLSLLQERGDRVCTRDFIAERLWPGCPITGVSDEMIDALVSRLRRRLREMDPAKDYIATVRGHGFRLII